MKKLFVCLLSLAVYAVSTVSTVSAAPAENVTILGDSIATGYGLEGYSAGDPLLAEESFGSLLSRRFGGEYTNRAVDGSTTADLLAALENGEHTISGGTVIVSIGGNDLLQPMLSALQSAVLSDPAAIQAMLSGEAEPDMAQLTERYSDRIIEEIGGLDLRQSILNIEKIAQIINGAADCRLYMLTVYNPFEGIAGLEKLSDFAEQKLCELNSGIKSLDGVTVVDVNEAFRGRAAELTNILSADVHPNAAGHKVIFELICAQAPQPVY